MKKFLNNLLIEAAGLLTTVVITKIVEVLLF